MTDADVYVAHVVVTRTRTQQYDWVAACDSLTSARSECDSLEPWQSHTWSASNESRQEFTFDTHAIFVIDDIRMITHSTTCSSGLASNGNGIKRKMWRVCARRKWEAATKRRKHTFKSKNLHARTCAVYVVQCTHGRMVVANGRATSDSNDWTKATKTVKYKCRREFAIMLTFEVFLVGPFSLSSVVRWLIANRFRRHFCGISERHKRRAIAAFALF